MDTILNSLLTRAGEFLHRAVAYVTSRRDPAASNI